MPVSIPRQILTIFECRMTYNARFNKLVTFKHKLPHSATKLIRAIEQFTMHLELLAAHKRLTEVQELEHRKAGKELRTICEERIASEDLVLAKKAIPKEFKKKIRELCDSIAFLDMEQKYLQNVPLSITLVRRVNDLAREIKAKI